jgi:hypothetical protein
MSGKDQEEKTELSPPPEVPYIESNSENNIRFQISTKKSKFGPGGQKPGSVLIPQKSGETPDFDTSDSFPVEFSLKQIPREVKKKNTLSSVLENTEKLKYDPIYDRINSWLNERHVYLSESVTNDQDYFLQKQNSVRQLITERRVSGMWSSVPDLNDLPTENMTLSAQKSSFWKRRQRISQGADDPPPLNLPENSLKNIPGE